MKFEPKTEKQIQEENLMPPAIYDFEVADATDKISKSNNEMIVLTLKVFDADGNPRFVTDYLLESMAFKLRHAADACGLLTEYDMGELRSGDFKGASGKVKVKIQKDKTGEYADKNVVADYIKRDLSNGIQPPAGHPVLDDEIPTFSV